MSLGDVNKLKSDEEQNIYIVSKLFIPPSQQNTHTLQIGKGQVWQSQLLSTN